MSIINDYFKIRPTIEWEQEYASIIKSYEEYRRYEMSLKNERITDKFEYGNYTPMPLLIKESKWDSSVRDVTTKYRPVIKEAFDEDYEAKENNYENYAVLAMGIDNRSLKPVLENVSLGIIIFAQTKDPVYTTSASELNASQILSTGAELTELYAMNLIEGTLDRIAYHKHGNEIVSSTFKSYLDQFETMVKHNKIQTHIHYSNFTERIYDLDEGKLDPTIDLLTHFRMSRYFGNLYQSLLLTTNQSTWFLNAIADSLSGFGLQLSQKNLQTWFNMNHPDFKYLIEQPNSDLFILYQIARKHKEISLKEFLKVAPKIQELNDKFLKEFDQNLALRGRRIRDNRVYLKGTKGRNIMYSQTLPQFMIKYVNNKLFNSNISLYQYLKYIIDEGKRAYQEGERLSLQRIEELLYDYNHMLKEINPKAKFVLPYKLRNAHDTMVTNFNIINADKLAANKTGQYSFNQIYSIANEHCFDNEKYIMTRPESAADLAFEGTTLNHCVGGYAGRVQRGETMIFFLRREYKPKDPFITIEVTRYEDRFNLIQIKGKSNKDYLSEYEYNPYRNDPDVIEIRNHVKNWLLNYREDYIQKEEIKKQQALIERSATRNYDKPLVEYLMLQGYQNFYYNKDLSKEENIRNTITSALVHIMHTKREKDLWQNDYLDLMRTDLKKILKEATIKHKDVMPYDNNKYIDLSYIDYDCENVDSIANVMKNYPELIALGTKEIQKTLIKEKVPEEELDQIGLEL